MMEGARMARHERDYGRDDRSREHREDRSVDPRRDRQERGYRDEEFRSEGREAYDREEYGRGARERGYDGGMRDYPGGHYGNVGRGPLDFPERGGYGNAAYGGGDQNLEGWQDQRGGMSSERGWRGHAIWRRPRASQIMTENPHVVTPEVSIEDAAMKMRDLDVGIIPVVDSMESRRLTGVITDRDITIRAVARGMGADARVADCMTDGVRAVNKNDSIQDVMWVMRREQVRRVPVTDREGRLVGIIAQADLAVDYAGDDRTRETEVGETIERISEPGRPDRPGMGAADRSSRNDPEQNDGSGVLRGARRGRTREDN